ncbi:MAG: VIT1/CCC1 transporter family protein [Candidatus Aenigmarchaeota archaeon]|nr:VIT1/CCC1 transporter family protein [Candidatus Aenigmarchaeota archaeon]
MAKERWVKPGHFKEPHIIGGKSLREFIFGVEDGLISSVGIVTGVVGAAVGSFFIVLAGVISMFAGALSMAAGTYLSIKSENDYYKQEIEKERWEIKKFPELEKAELRTFLIKRGYKGKRLERELNTIWADKELVLKYMLEDELGISQDKFKNPITGAAVMFLSYIFGSVIPLISYIFLLPNIALGVSLSLTVASLFVFGAYRHVYTGKNWIASGLEMMVIGMFVAAVGYYLGTLFAA